MNADKGKPCPGCGCTCGSCDSSAPHDAGCPGAYAEGFVPGATNPSVAQEARDIRCAANLPQAWMKIMARLADLLDEDQFKDIEDIARTAGVQYPNVFTESEQAGKGEQPVEPAEATGSLAVCIEGMKHWDWCPICRSGLDTGLECDNCGADLMPIYTAFKESLSGGNPGEPKACTPAEERGIVGATGAGQLPDGKPGSTVDSAERRSPDDTTGPSSPDESNRHLSSKSTVWMAKNRAYSETCYFGNYATAVAWAKGGTVVPVEVQHYTSPALRVPRTDMLAEAVRMIQGYKRAGWLTNPAAGEQAIDFIARASHEPEGWRPIETAPRNGSRILLCADLKVKDRIGGGRYSVEPYTSEGGEIIGAAEGFQGDSDQCIPSNQEVFTHWMPLPSAPSTKLGVESK